MNPSPRPKLGILGSGKGSNYVALAQAIADNRLQADVALVLSDVPEAGILAEARRHNHPALHIHPGRFRTKLDESAETAYIDALRQHQVDFLILAGFMRILKGELLQSFAGRVLNIHPSLLPAFPGLAAWKQALDYGVKITGCTVHLVDQGIDTGPILGQAAVPVLPHDSPESLHARIQEAERSLYPTVVASFIRGEYQVRGRIASQSPPRN